MNPQAQNAFLKTLEEPPPDTVLVLVTAAPGPPAPHPAQPLRPAGLRAAAARAGRRTQVQRRLELSPEVAEAVASLADGSLERALALDAEHLADRRGPHRALRGGDPRRTSAPCSASPRRRGAAGRRRRRPWRCSPSGCGTWRWPAPAARASSTPSCGRWRRRWRPGWTTTRSTGASGSSTRPLVAIRQRNAAPAAAAGADAAGDAAVSDPLAALLAEVKAGKVRPLYLCWGEEYLVRRDAEALAAGAGPRRRGGPQLRGARRRLAAGDCRRADHLARSSPAGRWCWSATRSSSPRRRAGWTRWPRCARRGRPDGGRKSARRLLALVARAGWGAAEVDPAVPGAPVGGGLEGGAGRDPGRRGPGLAPGGGGLRQGGAHRHARVGRLAAAGRRWSAGCPRGTP